ncbi:ABC transporter ATP-binding protein [Crassaminicella thermophila]|uniref:ABC transporter ATP-binding protein n=1 Tax=Crassaminicella thermophila TaxID=2599308 RepID=A0A5C0SDB5_CRATE|nr:ABC transporter ATP-binding protein [Crassaminicella thermophila]QEK11388.1 ABC transporter ATP-binding protein [Crassaminicella thermophila]
MANIKIKNLNYQYPETKNLALNNINLEIPQGQFVLLVGGSGSGKSTLIRSIAGLVPNFYGGKYGGEVYLDDKEIRQIDRRSFVQQVGMVFQDPESQLVMTNLEEEIVFGLENLELPNSLMKRRVMEVSSALSLSDYKNKFIPELSGGQKQKVALASVLAMQPDILLLDEPTSQLDPIAGEEILTMVRRLNEENGITVVLTEQRLERCFHLADRVLVMERGEIIYDHHDPKTIAEWAVDNKTPFIPPLAKLFANVGYREVPVTVKHGREILRSYRNKLKPIRIDSEKRAEKFEKTEEACLVDIKNLWFTYPNGKEVLKNINLKIKPGDFIVVMGENGGGKTTLMKHINGLLKPSRGHVKVLGKDTKKMSIEELSSIIGYLSQDPNDYLFLPTVREEVAFTLEKLGIKDDRIQNKILQKLQIDSLKERNPRDLSTGQRQRVALASILVTKPKLLLLDEPTRGLDYQLKEALGEVLLKLKEEGMTIFMIAHDVEFAAEYADEIILLDGGSIIARGNKYEMLTNSTFYSPQISKLFHNFVENVVTLDQGEVILRNMIGSDQKEKYA